METHAKPLDRKGSAHPPQSVRKQGAQGLRHFTAAFREHRVEDLTQQLQVPLNNLPAVRAQVLKELKRRILPLTSKFFVHLEQRGHRLDQQCADPSEYKCCDGQNTVAETGDKAKAGASAGLG